MRRSRCVDVLAVGRTRTRLWDRRYSSSSCSGWVVGAVLHASSLSAGVTRSVAVVLRSAFVLGALPSLPETSWWSAGHGRNVSWRVW